MARIGLEHYTDVPGEVAALEAYWLLAEDGETWVQTVTEVRAAFGLKAQELTRIVQSGGTAFIVDIACTECGGFTEVAHRTEFASLVRQGNIVCSSCQLLAQQERAEAERKAAQQRREVLLARFPIHSTDPLAVDSLSLFQAVALHAMFGDPAVEDAGLTTPTSIWPKDRRWAPENILCDLERRLLHAEPRTVRVHPDSHQDAFVWKDDAPDGSHYLGQVSYYLYGPEEQLRARSPHLLHTLNQTFREGPWPSQWHDQWRDLWNELTLSYASTYLDMKLGEHHLEMKQGDGTLAALKDALATFSLGQVFNFIYRATKDSAAYYQRGGVNKRQAANSTVGRISAAADRARANGWEIKSFGRPWSLPLSAIGETFFSKVMWQADMMLVPVREVVVPQHAAAVAHADVPQQAQKSPGEASDGWPPEPSDDDIEDCGGCGRRIYGNELCKECQAV
ncbi:hypothetical protein [Streptomyces sp. ISL-100]|uniref:hypothetical protein n=1 Tax=Streptomyces sp. ISL-100 TaxID=2819173 RepID=UPI001BE5BBBF|nr:hypothetical protein [Streptomyces sp. ISL-100]MBT2401511.1 hypothetical protein [Streptomyces sp. ISL-100]